MSLINLLVINTFFLAFLLVVLLIASITHPKKRSRRSSREDLQSIKKQIEAPAED